MMVIEIKSYVPKPLDVFHEIFTIPLLCALKGYKHHGFLHKKVFVAENIHHVTPSRDGSWLQANILSVSMVAQGF